MSRKADYPTSMVHNVLLETFAAPVSLANFGGHLKRRVSKAHLVWYASFALVGLFGLVGCFRIARGRANDEKQLMGLFLFFCCLSCIGLTVPLMQRIAERSTRERSAVGNLLTCEVKYVARHSNRDRTVYVCLLAAWVSLTAFLSLHPGPVLFKVVAYGMLCMLAVCAYRICLTTVRFTDREITIRIIPFVHFSEQYGDIAHVRVRAGNLRIRFKDGKAMNIWSGLGEARRITSILMHETEVLPDID
jgi:hypothetical protein